MGPDEHLQTESPEGVGQRFHRACEQAMREQRALTFQDRNAPKAPMRHLTGGPATTVLPKSSRFKELHACITQLLPH